MSQVTFDVQYPEVAPEEVMLAYWRAERWPAVAKHVTDIEILYEDDSVQVLRMHVATKKRRDAFNTVRILQDETLHYFQPKPPPALRRHRGVWKIAPAEGGGTVVTSFHEFEIDPGPCARFLTSLGKHAESQEDLVQLAGDVLTHNSLQTMEALRDLLTANEKQEVRHA